MVKLNDTLLNSVTRVPAAFASQQRPQAITKNQLHVHLEVQQSLELAGLRAD